MRNVYDKTGMYVASVSDEYSTKALNRREIFETDDGFLILNDQPINALSPEVKRRIHLAKQRGK